MTSWADEIIGAAMAACEAKQFAQAETALQFLIGRGPTDPFVLYVLGHLAYLRGALPEAAFLLSHAVRMNPQNARAFNDLGETLRTMGDNAAAEGHLRHAIQLDPSLAYAYGNLATALLALDRPEDALRSAQEALRRGAEKTVAHCDLGSIFGRLNRAQEALRQFDLSLTHDPNNARARYMRGLVRLSLGQMPDAWQDHEARLLLPAVASGTRAIAGPRWTGAEDINGKTILLHAEQGFGDTIQFLRYLPQVQSMAAAQGAQLLLEVPADLATLCHFAGVQVIATGAPLPAFDLHCGLMSLPALFATDLATIPATCPYLGVDAGLSAAWASALGPWQRMRIGIAWSGHPRHAADNSRSIRLQTLRPLLDRRDVDCHVVQRDIRPTDDPAGFDRLIDHSASLTDFAQTAALLANMDLVITVDTVIAHLAGALAIPTWVLLPHSADWRWLRAREDSPWYPSLRLFRQPNRGDWASVLDAVSRNLDQWAVRPS